MTTPQLTDLLERGDRTPNFFLPDQRDVIINLADKARGGPLFIFLFPTQKDPGALAEFQAMLAAAPGMLEASAHLFAITADPVPLVQKLAEAHQPDFFVLSDKDKKVATRFGARARPSDAIARSTDAPRGSWWPRRGRTSMRWIAVAAGWLGSVAAAAVGMVSALRTAA